MPRAPYVTRLALRAWRRASAAALLSLQIAFAVSPTFERAKAMHVDTHAEQQGRAHLFAHDESTCVVCSVRTIAVDAPQSAVMPAMATASRKVASGVALAQPFEPLPGPRSRAPPFPD